MAVIKRNTVTERKNAFDGLISRLDTAEEKKIPLGPTGWLEWAGVGYFPSPRSVESESEVVADSLRPHGL